MALRFQFLSMSSRSGTLQKKKSRGDFVMDLFRFANVPTLHPSFDFYYFSTSLSFQCFINISSMACHKIVIFGHLCLNLLCLPFMFCHVTWCDMSQSGDLLSQTFLSLLFKFYHGFSLFFPWFHIHIIF